MKRLVILTRIINGLLTLVLLLATSTSAQAGEDQPRPKSSPQADARPVRWFVDYIEGSENRNNQVGQYLSMAFDPDLGRPYVSYYDAANQDLKVARYTGPGVVGNNCGQHNDWFCETVDEEGNVGLYSSIDYLPPKEELNLHWKLGVSYFDETNKTVKYAEYFCYNETPGACDWSIFEVTKSDNLTHPVYTSLRFDPFRAPHIAYYSPGLRYYLDGSLNYSSYVGNELGNCQPNQNWECEQIDVGSLEEGVGGYVSLGIDRNGIPAIAYYDFLNGNLKFAQFYGEGGNCGPDRTWECQIVDSAGDLGKFATMYVPRVYGQPIRIAYYDANGWLKLAEKRTYGGGNCGKDGEFQCDFIAPMESGLEQAGISLATTPDGDPYIAFQGITGDAAKGSLQVATPTSNFGNCGSTLQASTFLSSDASSSTSWLCQTLDGPGNDQTSYSAYIAAGISDSGLISIAYYEVANFEDASSYDGNLKIAYQWLTQFLPLTKK